jgi:hypothetical protein
MKNIKKILLGTLILVGLQFGLFGCIVPVGGRGGGGWVHDGPWMDGGRGGFGGGVHPPGFRR